MSWSVSAAAKRDEAIRTVREQFARCTYLPAGEGGRGEKILDTIEKFAQSSVGENDVLKISAWGSESTFQPDPSEPSRILSISGGYSVAVERPAPVPQVEAAPEVDTSGYL